MELTVGMATFDDFDGVYFSCMSVRRLPSRTIPSTRRRTAPLNGSSLALGAGTGNCGVLNCNYIHVVPGSAGDGHIDASNFNGGSFTGAGPVSVSGNITCDQISANQYNTRSPAMTVINGAGTFVGAGVYCLTSGIAGAGFNPYVGSTQYFGVATGSFTTADGKTATVRGGVIVALA